MFRNLIVFSFVFFFNTAYLYAQDYRKAVDTPDNVKNKRYPKIKKIELDLQGGGVLNQSYVNSFAVNGSLTYFWSETFGLSLDGVMYMNSDKAERDCIENFYNNFDLAPIAAECNPAGTAAQATSDLQGTTANMGPAYVPIRENNYSIGARLIWAPIYGKQLIMLSQTNYFDVFFSVGGGMVFSTFYPEQKNLRGTNRPARGSQDLNPGASPNETGLYGKAGRPDSKDEMNIYLDLGIGQKYHFGGKFHLKFELRNYTLLFTEETGFDNYFTLLAGVGMRI